MKCSPLIVGMASAMMVACSGSSSDGPLSETTPAPALPEVNPPQVFIGGLVQKGSQGTALFLKNGLYASTQGLPIQTFNEGDAASTRGGFSTTNTQESGVDEADRIEYDGNYLYLAQPPVWHGEAENTKPTVRVLQRQSDYSLQQVKQATVGEGRTEINGMYLAQERLSVVHSNYPIMTFARMFAPFNPGPGQVSLSVFDSQTPADLPSVSEVKIEGWLVSSRRINQYIYVITGSSPTVQGLTYGENSDEGKLNNYRLIQNTDIKDMMPKITVNGQTRALHQSEECYAPALAGSKDGARQVVSVTRINTLEPTEIDSLCLLGQADAMYMSAENLYLTGTLENQTILHKVSLSEKLAYQASGKVAGTLGWQANPNFRLDEEQGYLRVVTSDYQEKPLHRLNILEQQGRELKSVAQLPNDQQTAAIGKPEEDIYAVRFIGDKGYIVTFERTDPLYVLDLSNPQQPLISGSLEIPGFSSYLHPMDNGFVLGVGQEVALEELPRGDEGTLVSTPVRQGVKVSLFDATDPTNPTEVATLVKDKGYTPVEFDYKALSVLKNGSQYQFAMPVEQWLKCDETCIASSFKSQHSLMMMDVNATPGAGALSEVRQWEVKTEQPYVFGGLDRSVIHGEHVYYIHGNQVWHSLWQADAAVDGPY